MNELIAENRYTLTKELFYEGMKRVSKENYAPFAKKAVICIAVAWLIMAAVTLILKQSPIYIAVEAVVLLFAALWVTVYMPWHKRRKAYKKLEEQYGSFMERTASFYNEELTVNAAGREVTVRYEDIVKIFTTERLIILLTEEKTGIMIEKSGFTAGKASDIYGLIDRSK